MRFVCDPISIVLLTGLTFVFVLLAVLLGHAIVVMSGLRRIVRKLNTVSEEVESMLTAPIEAVENVVTSIATFIQDWISRRKGKAETPGKVKGGRRRQAAAFATKDLT